MQGNRGRDTKPELAVRKLVHAAGLRYRVDARPEARLPRKADLVFRRSRIAVFVDGCFWHACPEHYVASKTRLSYWEAKIAGNRQRDAETTALLRERGWQVLRFWAHEDPEQVAQQIEAAVRSGQSLRTSPSRGT